MSMLIFCTGPPPINPDDPSPVIPTTPPGDPITRITGNKIELMFAQPSNVNGPLRYVEPTTFEKYRFFF